MSKPFLARTQLVIVKDASRQYQRPAGESITAPLKDIEYVDFDGELALQVPYRRSRESRS